MSISQAFIGGDNVIKAALIEVRDEQEKQVDLSALRNEYPVSLTSIRSKIRQALGRNCVAMETRLCNQSDDHFAPVLRAREYHISRLCIKYRSNRAIISFVQIGLEFIIIFHERFAASRSAVFMPVWGFPCIKSYAAF